MNDQKSWKYTIKLSTIDHLQEALTELVLVISSLVSIAIKNQSDLKLKVCGQNANRTKCQPDISQPKVGILSGLFSVVGILSDPTFWLAFCPDHLNMFWHFVTIMKITFQITFHKKAKSISKTGSDEGKLSQLLRTLCKEKEVDTMR